MHTRIGGIIVIAVALSAARGPEASASGNWTNTIDGTTLSTNGPITVGDGFVASDTNAWFRVLNGGQFVVSGDTRLGLCYLGNYNGVVVNGPGSYWTNRAVMVGNSGQWNRVSIEAGGAVHSITGMIGRWSVASNNAVVVTGPGSTWTVPRLYVGAEGTGNGLVISNGGSVLSEGAYVSWRGRASDNRVVVTGPGSSWVDLGTVRVGETGSQNRVTLSDGGSLTAGGVQIGTPQGSSDQQFVDVAGGRLVVTNAGATAEVTVHPGSLTVSAGSMVADRILSPWSSQARLQFLGGTSTVGSVEVQAGGMLSIDGGVLRVGVLSGSMDFQLNSGTLSIATSSSVSQSISVGGTGAPAELVFENPDGLYAFNDINITNGGTLRGAGNGPTIGLGVGGTLAPAAGTTGLDVPQVYFAGGTYAAVLDATATGSRVECDEAYLAFSTYLDVDASACFAPSGTVHVLVDCGVAAYLWSSFRLPDETVLANGDTFTADGQEFSIHYDYDIDSGTYGTGNDIVLQQLPEPGAAILVALGGLLAAGGRRILRRRARRDGP